MVDDFYYLYYHIIIAISYYIALIMLMTNAACVRLIRSTILTGSNVNS